MARKTLWWAVVEKPGMQTRIFAGLGRKHPRV